MNDSQLHQYTPRRGRAIGPIGTWARLLLGGGMLAALYLAPSGDRPNAWQALLGLAGFTAVLAVVQIGYARMTGKRLNATGPLGYLVPLAAGTAAALLYPPILPGFAVFIAASLLLAGIRGYAGCEITAISNWLLRRDDQVGCVLLSPLDHAERGRRRHGLDHQPQQTAGHAGSSDTGHGT
ncbi:hypothetical protein AB0D27_07160 [Streptomyces sp. NPDC048415]|uniref:hypothetical protein n=1 Tax=Streptomyces sp. NPDC048415 TaxID=3154822 RepID=UPI003434DB94